MDEAATSLFWIVLCIVVAPLVAGLIPRRMVPEVVLLLVLGVVVGPNVLELAKTGEAIGILRELGLGLLFLLAGYEIELEELTGRAGRRALWTWLACLVTALGVVWLIGLSGAIHAEAAVAIALTSTALGTLLPILKDNGLLGTRFGTIVSHHGAYGELGPIVAMSVLLGTRGAVASVLVLLGFGVLVVVVSMFSSSLAARGLEAAEHHPGGGGDHRADHGAAHDAAAGHARRAGRFVRPRRRARCVRGGPGAPAADPRRARGSRAPAERSRLRAADPDLLRDLGHGDRPGGGGECPRRARRLRRTDIRDPGWLGLRRGALLPRRRHTAERSRWRSSRRPGCRSSSPSRPPPWRPAR